MSHPRLREQKSTAPNLVFFKNFISIEANQSLTSNFVLERKLQRPQRSHIALKKAVNDIDNNHGQIEDVDEHCQLRRSVTSEAKRIHVEQPLIHNQFNVLMRTIHRKAGDGERSKTVGKCHRQDEDDNKYAKIGEINKMFKERRQKSLKAKVNNSFHRSLVQEKSANPTVNLKLDAKRNANTKSRTNTLPLQAKYYSSSHLAPLCNNMPFEVTESSEILLSNLLNPEPEGKQLRKESSDSAKRFYLKLKKKKQGSLWKPFEKELTLLDGESVTKQIPSELGIYKIMLPKRNYRHEFLQNIQKIKENYLRIKGNAQNVKQKLKDSPIRSFQKTTINSKRRQKKMYEIKYRGEKEAQDKQLIRSRTQFFQNRSQWQAFNNTPLEPWETDDNIKLQ